MDNDSKAGIRTIVLLCVVAVFTVVIAVGISKINNGSDMSVRPVKSQTTTVEAKIESADTKTPVGSKPASLELPAQSGPITFTNVKSSSRFEK